MVRVLLRRVDVGVHLGFAVEAHLLHTVLPRPVLLAARVEALDRAADRKRRLVGDASVGDVLALDELGERLRGIVAAVAARAGEDDGLGGSVHTQDVALLIEPGHIGKAHGGGRRVARRAGIVGLGEVDRRRTLGGALLGGALGYLNAGGAEKFLHLADGVGVGDVRTHEFNLGQRERAVLIGCRLGHRKQLRRRAGCIGGIGTCTRNRRGDRQRECAQARGPFESHAFSFLKGIQTAYHSRVMCINGRTLLAGRYPFLDKRQTVDFALGAASPR